MFERRRCNRDFVRIGCAHVVGAALNPYLRLLYFGESQQPGLDQEIEVIETPGISIRWIWANRNNIDVLHLHWPSYYYDVPGSMPKKWCRLFRMSIGLVLARILGIKIVWTAHNILPHSSLGRIDYVARRIVIKMSDLILAHHEEVLSELHRKFRISSATSVVPHMTYDGAYGVVEDKRDARKKLGLSDDSLIIIHFGVARKNKNLEGIIASFIEGSSPGQVLVIAGECDPDLASVYEEVGIRHPRIIWHNREISDQEVGTYLCAADTAVIASEIATSGTLFLYLTFSLPIILPDKMSREFVACSDWLLTYSPNVPQSLDEVFSRLEKPQLEKRSHAASLAKLCRRPKDVHNAYVTQIYRLCGIK